VVDGHPATLAWIGAVKGHRTRPIGVEHFGQSGTIAALYRYFGLDAAGIMSATNSVSNGRPLRFGARAF
jgi:pyruvate dehydrogenase E1 component